MRAKLTAVFISLVLVLFSLAPPAWSEPAPDYGQRQCWLSLPEKPAKSADVFWIYPTVYQGGKPVADFDDPQMKRAARYTLQSQAAVFADCADIYAPLYRQVGMKALKLAPPEKERALSTGARDIQAAFGYYLKHHNRGRPLILAGHSQGAEQLLKLLKKRLAEDGLRKLLVAAYVVGFSVTTSDLAQYPHLKMCRGPRQTGCVISYNSVAKGYAKAAPTITKGAVALNPLTWTTGPKLAPASKNLGSMFVAQDGSQTLVPNFASARVDGGAIIVDAADPGRLTRLPFGPGVYHAYDYALFFENLKQNAKERVEAFKSGSR